MRYLNLKPSHKAVKTYFKDIKTVKQSSFLHEGNVAPHFANLLSYCSKQFQWQLHQQYPLKRQGKHPLYVDGALLDEFRLVHGWWEAKDDSDNLENEVRKKFNDGYPRDNILFQSPARAILYQNGDRIFDTPLNSPPMYQYKLGKRSARYWSIIQCRAERLPSLY